MLSQVFSQESLSRDSGTQKALVVRLSSSDEERRMDTILRLWEIFSETPGSADFSTVTALAMTMRSDISPVVRALAVRALEICRDPRASEPLITALGTESELAVRKAIVYALANYPSRETTSILVPLLKDKEPEIRAAAAASLSHIRDPLAAPALLEVLQKRSKDEDAFARSRAAYALGFIGDHTTLDSLIRALIKDKSSDVRREAAQALGRLATAKDAKALEALKEIRISSDPYLTATVDAAIADINSRNQL